MGFTMQTQRRAIEALLPHVASTWPKEVFAGKHLLFRASKFPDAALIQQDLIDFWGVSVGIGTCSDIHGVDVAVFGLRSGNNAHNNTKDFKFLSSCAYAVLVWPAELRVISFKGSKIIRGNSHDIHKLDYRSCDDPLHQNIRFIELLDFLKIEECDYEFSELRAKPSSIHFLRTGTVTSHIPIV